MKKTIAFSVATVLMLAAVLSGCKDKDNKKDTTKGTSEAVTETEVVSSEAQVMADVANEKPVFLYYLDYGASEAVRLNTFSAPWTDSEDLGCFGAFAADEERIYFDSEISAHQEDWDAVETAVDYRIGYEISFDVNGSSRLYTILEPKDIVQAEDLFMGDWDSEEITGYVGVWVYDDYHQEGGFYVHVGEDEFDENTLLTSIKIRLTPKCDSVDNLKIKVFSYSSPLEFDSEGHYNNRYGNEISIVRE